MLTPGINEHDRSCRSSARSHAGAALMFMFALCVSSYATPVLAQAPQIDIELRWAPAILLKSGANGFMLSYSLSTPHTAEEFAEFFPREALGGRRDACGYEVIDGGMVLVLEEPVLWLGAEASPNPGSFTLDPPAMQALLLGGPAVAAATVSARDTVAEQIIRFDGTPLQSGLLTLYTDDATELAWTLTLQVDCYCSYRTREGEVVGRLTNADLREKPSVAIVRGQLIPPFVANESPSWGMLKEEFRRP